MEEMDVIKVSKYCGLTKRTIYNMVSTGRIPYRRLSEKRVVFIKEDIDAWLKKRQEAKQQKIPLSKFLCEERFGDALSQNKDPETNKPESEKIQRELSTAEEESSLKVKDQGTLLMGMPSTITSGSGAARKKLKSPFRMRLNALQVGALGLVLVIIGWAGGVFFIKKSVKENNYNSTAKDFAYASEIVPVVGKATINNIDFNQEDDEKGPVNLTLDYLSKTVDLEGSVSDPRIRPFLLNSLMNEDECYAIKLKVIDAVQNWALSPDIRKALIHVIAKEKDPVVRLKAMTVLAKYIDSTDVREALLDRFKNDENTGIRYKALAFVENKLDANVLSFVKHALMKEKAQIVRNKALAIIDRAE